MVNLNELQVGDHVRYKMQGRFGSFEAVVTGVGLKRVGIRMNSYMNMPLPAGEVFKIVSPKSLTAVMSEL
jgi:hypothetical protein